MDVENSFHARTNEYTYRVPTPPRIVVPPPILGADLVPAFTLQTFKNADFLADINYDNLVTSNVLLDWSYERRRQSQMILPFLFLGPMMAAKDRLFLQREGITMLLGIRQNYGLQNKVMNGALRVADELGIRRDTIDLATNQELIAAFPRVTRAINQHLHEVHQLSASGHPGVPKTGKVLVFCESGNERSAGVVAAYLMEMFQDVDHVKAVQICQAQRFCVNFDDGMKHVLQSYWDILRARRDVSASETCKQSQTQVLSSSGKTSKRALEPDDGSDMDMDGGADEARFERRNFAPFVDTT